MIYLILTGDLRYAEKPSMRIQVQGKIKNFNIVTYANTEEEAKELCRTGGKFPGSQENRFWFYKVKKLGE